MMLYLRLFFEFFKTGLFTIGGGMATVPFLYKMSTATGWFTHNDVANMIAVSESTPGPIGVNMATYIGFVTGMEENGILGAILGSIIATLGLITPSIIIILIYGVQIISLLGSKNKTGIQDIIANVYPVDTNQTIIYRNEKELADAVRELSKSPYNFKKD